MLCNAYQVRRLTPLLNDNDNPTDDQIRDYIRDVDSTKIGVSIAGRYKHDPITPTSYLSGTITVNKGSKVISGTSTTLTDLKPGDVIQIVKTLEVLEVQEIISDTSLNTFSTAVNDSTASEFWIIPRELVTVSKFWSAQVAIMLHCPEKTINQDNIEKFDRRLEYFAGNTIKQLQSGNYFNSGLVAQSKANTPGRYLKIFENDNKTANDTFISNVINFS